MRRDNKGLRRKRREGIASLSIITTPLAITLCVLFFQQEGPSLFDHVASGSSFYFPSIPFIDLLGFLPESARNLPFTVGNLVDVMVNVYIILTVGIVPYWCHKSAREPGIAFKDVMRPFHRVPRGMHTRMHAFGPEHARGGLAKRGKKDGEPHREQMILTTHNTRISFRLHLVHHKQGDGVGGPGLEPDLDFVMIPRIHNAPVLFGSIRSASLICSFFHRSRACLNAARGNTIPAMAARATIARLSTQLPNYKEM